MLTLRRRNEQRRRMTEDIRTETKLLVEWMLVNFFQGRIEDMIREIEVSMKM